MHLLVTRPQADARVMSGRLQAAGHTVTVEPLLMIEPVDPGPLDLAGVQALLVTSRNAIRALAQTAGIAGARQLPLIAVGPGTAAAARDAGFVQVTTGPAAARELVPLVQAARDPAAGALLHLSGESVAFDLEQALSDAGFAVHTRVIYHAKARARLTETTVQAMRTGAIDGVILMSPRTAAIYADLIGIHDLLAAAANAVHICLSAAVAVRLARLGPLRRAVAVQPNLEEMLALVARVAAQSTPRS